MASTVTGRRFDLSIPDLALLESRAIALRDNDRASNSAFHSQSIVLV